MVYCTVNVIKAWTKMQVYALVLFPLLYLFLVESMIIIPVVIAK